MLWNAMKDGSATLEETDSHEPDSWRLPACDSFGLPLLGRLLGYWATDSNDWQLPPSDESEHQSRSVS